MKKGFVFTMYIMVLLDSVLLLVRTKQRIMLYN